MAQDFAIGKIENLIEPVINDLGYELVRVRILSVSGAKTLQIMAERPDGSMGVDGCAEISRALSALLDVEDPINGEYNLEVSSPGISRPLVRLKDFERFKGELAKVELTELVDGRRRFKGILDGIEEENVLICESGDKNEDDEEMVWSVPFHLIGDAHLIVTDELLRRDLSGKGQSQKI